MSQDDAVLAALREAQEEMAEADRALFTFYERLVEAIQQRKAALALPLAQLYRAEEAEALAASGEPHLGWNSLVLTNETLYPWFEEIAALFATQDPGIADEAEAVAPETCLALAQQWFEAGQSDLGPAVDALLANTLAPYLEVAAQTLLPHLPLDEWQRPYCPICGGFPNFALWDTRSGARHLLCERCAAEWRADAPGCAFCGEEEPDQLGYYSTEEPCTASRSVIAVASTSKGWTGASPGAPVSAPSSLPSAF
jgi:formate dehydrogenase maturation protein FdhE